MTNPAPGSTVYVSWYGKTLQGVIVPDDTNNPLFASMLHVRVPIQGTPVIAVFTPSHVHTSPDSIPSPDIVTSSSSVHPPLSSIGCASSATPSVPSPSWSTPSLDAHRARYRQFLADHWDHSRNRLRTDAIDAFYTIFREGVALRRRHLNTPSSTPPRPPVSYTAAPPQSTKKHNPPLQLSLNF